MTDGKEWHFYLPAETGSYEERRLYKLDMMEREVQESAFRFSRYLDFKNVSSGDSLDNARKRLQKHIKTKTNKANIPIAWDKLLEEKR